VISPSQRFGLLAAGLFVVKFVTDEQRGNLE
jgi:hypothetical protein